MYEQFSRSSLQKKIGCKNRENIEKKSEISSEIVKI